MIRRAELSDAAAVHALVGELGYAGLDRAEFDAGFAEVLRAPGQEVWVAELGTPPAVVGLLAMTHKPQLRLAGALLTIDEIVVAESARGAGIGGRLMEHAKVAALRVGARRVELHTQRARASYERGFYVKNGFVEMDAAVMRWAVNS